MLASLKAVSAWLFEVSLRLDKSAKKSRSPNNSQTYFAESLCTKECQLVI